MTSIDIRFSDLGWGFISRAVSWSTGHWANHVDLVTENGAILSAVPFFGVQEWPERVVSARRVETVTLPCTEEQRAKVLTFARAEIGKSYDYSGVLAFSFRPRWNEKGRWFCSELTAAALQEAKLITVPKFAHRVSPGDLYRLVTER